MRLRAMIAIDIEADDFVSATSAFQRLWGRSPSSLRAKFGRGRTFLKAASRRAA